MSQEVSAKKVASQNMLILDVRTPSEFTEKRLANSINIPLANLPSFTKELSEVSVDIAVLCRTGKRAAQAQEILSEAGIESAVVSGGILGWQNQEMPVLMTPKEWPIERQVRLGAGSLVLLGVVLGWTVNPWFYALSGFVGAGLVFAGITDSCGMAKVLSSAWWNQEAFDSSLARKQLIELQ